MNDAVIIINMLVGLIYELYPDEEYEELYEIKDKLQLAKDFVKKQGVKA